MSNFYTPRFDGIHFDVAMPGRCPMTGQFVSGHEMDELDCEQPEQVVEARTETDEDRNIRIITADSSDPLTGSDDSDEEDFFSRSDEYYDERDQWRDCLGLEWGSSLSAETEAWAKWKYGQNFSHLWEIWESDIGEEFEYLPHRIGLHWSFKAHTENGIWLDRNDKRQSSWKLSGTNEVDSHGKYGRPKGYKLRKHRDIRAARRDTHRRMNSIWLAEMVEPKYSSTELALASSVSDAQAHLIEVNEELWYLGDWEDMRNHQHWEWHHPGPMTEALQNCHGFSGGDPIEEELERIKREWTHLEMLLDEHGFWGEYDSHYDDYPPEWDSYDDPIDRYEFGILTEEDEVYFDAEAAALEAEAEALEAAFEHLAVGNATGRRMQLAARAA